MHAATYLIALAAALLASQAVADQVALEGGRIDAQVERSPGGAPSQTTLATPYGKLVIEKSLVLGATSESPAEAEYRRRAPSVSDTVESQFALAQWCRDNGVATGMRRHLARVLELAPDHAEARMLLGYQQVDGRWMTRDDVLAARGLVRWQGQYRTPQEVALVEAAAQREAAALAWRRQLAAWRDALTAADRDAALAAEEQLTQLADPTAVPELLKLLADEREPELRRLYLRALGRMATGDALATLAQRALIDPDDEVRAEAVEQLALSGRPGVATPFVAALRADDPRVVNHAAWALGRLGSDAAVEPLIDALVTKHRRQVGNDSGGDQYNMTFGGPSPGTFGFGGGGPQTEVRASQNARVLDALVHLTGVNFLYDQAKWRAWLAAQQTEQLVDLRRDP